MSSKAVFAFARMNPPHSGHSKIVKRLLEEAEREGAVARLFLTQSCDKKRNPLDPATKVSFIQKLFPEVEVRLTKTVFTAGLDLSSEGIEDGVLIVGEDRAEAFEKMMSSYQGTDALGLKHAEVRTVARDAGDASATRAREAAAQGDYDAFRSLSASGDDTLTRELYEAVRTGLGVN